MWVFWSFLPYDSHICIKWRPSSTRRYIWGKWALLAMQILSSISPLPNNSSTIWSVSVIRNARIFPYFLIYIVRYGSPLDEVVDHTLLRITLLNYFGLDFVVVPRFCCYLVDVLMSRINPFLHLFFRSKLGMITHGVSYFLLTSHPSVFSVLF